MCKIFNFLLVVGEPLYLQFNTLSLTPIKTPKSHQNPLKIPMKSIILPFFFIFLHTHFPISSGVSIISPNSLKDNEFDPMVKRVCGSKISEYLDDEMVMESESSRRVLMMQKKYISYETLKRDLVPCGTPGASYYNCNGKGVAGHYNRGCEVITRCARDAINT